MTSGGTFPHAAKRGFAERQECRSGPSAFGHPSRSSCAYSAVWSPPAIVCEYEVLRRLRLFRTSPAEERSQPPSSKLPNSGPPLPSGALLSQASTQSSPRTNLGDQVLDKPALNPFEVDVRDSLAVRLHTPAPSAGLRRKRRILLRVFIAVQPVFVIWIITGLASHPVGPSAAEAAQRCGLGGW